MAMYWQHYYDTLWEALCTIIIHGVCSIVLLILLINTLYHFMVTSRKINPYRKHHMMSRKATRSIEPVPESPPLNNRVASHSNIIGSDSNITIGTTSQRTHTMHTTDNMRSKPATIALSMKILTTFYLCTIFLFSIISFIMRILMVFHDVKINCLIREHTIEIALLGRICLFIIFSYRLYVTFKNTSLAYPTYILTLFTIIAFTITNSTLIYFFIQVRKNRNTQTLYTYTCTSPGFSTTKAILPYFLCEFTFNAILVFLFCSKLVKSIRLLLQFSGGGQRMDFQVLKTIQLMSKLTLLMIIIFMSTLLILSIMTNYLSSACISLDNVINVICMLLVFKHNEKYYNTLCCGCNKLCVKLCLFCCMKGIHIRNNKYNKTKSNDGRTNLKLNMQKITNENECELNVEKQQIKQEDDDDDEEEEEEDHTELYQSEEYDITENGDNNCDTTYDIYVDTLTVIFLNEHNTMQTFGELPVPMFT